MSSALQGNGIRDVWLPVWTAFFLLFSFLYCAAKIAQDVVWGGNAWTQGDWLINDIVADVRRGLFGSVLIHISDFVGLDLVLFVALVQVAFLCALFLSFFHLVRKIDPSAAALLAISPAIFTVFWMADSQAAGRKEIIAFSGLMIFALGLVNRSWVALLASALILMMSFVAHEAMVLFVPLIWALIAMAHKARRDVTIPFAVATATTLFALYAAYDATRNTNLPDMAGVCAPLVARGLEESFCGGAIRWVTRDVDYAMQSVRTELALGGPVPFLLAYVAALLPLAYVLTRTSASRFTWAFLLLTLIPFLPLYVIAVDWGRWMSFHVFSIVLLTATGLRIGALRLEKPFKSSMLFALLLGAIFLSPSHQIDWVLGGAAIMVPMDVWTILN